VGSRNLIASRGGQFYDTGLDLEEVKRMNRRLDILIEAISMCHESNVEGTCGPRCIACRVEESMQSIEVAERMRDDG
jgi:hypothetical protein